MLRSMFIRGGDTTIFEVATRSMICVSLKRPEMLKPFLSYLCDWSPLPEESILSSSRAAAAVLARGEVEGNWPSGTLSTFVHSFDIYWSKRLQRALRETDPAVYGQAYSPLE